MSNNFVSLKFMIHPIPVTLAMAASSRSDVTFEMVFLVWLLHGKQQVLSVPDIKEDGMFVSRGDPPSKR